MLSMPQSKRPGHKAEETNSRSSPKVLISEANFTAIDFESAGTASGRTDAPIQVGTTSWSLAEGITDHWVSYIFTDLEITWKAQSIHGITTDDLADAPRLGLLWPDIRNRLQHSAVVAHGHGTEKRFLRSFPGHNFAPWIDTLLLYRAAYPKLKSHRLGALCDTFELTPALNAFMTEHGYPQIAWHDALYDAAASIFLLKHLIDSYSMQHLPLDVLCNPDISAWSQMIRS